MTDKHATILFAHGSRDPLWSRPIEAVAARMLAINPQCVVRCAYLELTQPDLPSVVAALAGSGITTLSVVPMFLGVGRHARQDLPELVAQLVLQYPDMAISLRPAIGEEPKVVDLLARTALG